MGSVFLEVLEDSEVMRCVLSECWRLGRVGFCLLEVLEVMRCVLLYAEGCGWWALSAGGVGCAVGDAMCALWMLEVMEGGLCLLEVLEAPEMMRRVLSVCWMW